MVKIGRRRKKRRKRNATGQLVSDLDALPALRRRLILITTSVSRLPTL